MYLPPPQLYHCTDNFHNWQWRFVLAPPITSFNDGSLFYHHFPANHPQQTDCFFSIPIVHVIAQHGLITVRPHQTDLCFRLKEEYHFCFPMQYGTPHSALGQPIPPFQRCERPFFTGLGSPHKFHPNSPIQTSPSIFCAQPDLLCNIKAFPQLVFNVLKMNQCSPAINAIRAASSRCLHDERSSDAPPNPSQNSIL